LLLTLVLIASQIKIVYTRETVLHRWKTEFRILRIAFGPKRQEVTRYRSKFNNKELHNIYYINIRKYGMGGTCNTHGRDEKFITNCFQEVEFFLRNL
jgi:hypothetical protein